MRTIKALKGAYMVPAERRPNRKQRRRSKAIALRANSIPIASASARRVAGLAGKLHEGLAENAKKRYWLIKLGWANAPEQGLRYVDLIKILA